MAGPSSRCVLLAIVALTAAGCNVVHVRGVGDPGGTGSPQPGAPTTSAGTCRVGVANQTAVPLDVTWVASSRSGGDRSGNLGRLEVNDTRSVSVLCGETVTAYGRGPGVRASGSAVARQFDDNWIRLTAGDSRIETRWYR